MYLDDKVSKVQEILIHVDRAMENIYAELDFLTENYQQRTY